jgi:hypothetical protein
MRILAMVLLLGTVAVAQDFTGEIHLLLENAIVRDGVGTADVALYLTCSAARGRRTCWAGIPS